MFYIESSVVILSNFVYIRLREYDDNDKLSLGKNGHVTYIQTPVLEEPLIIILKLEPYACTT